MGILRIGNLTIFFVNRKSCIYFSKRIVKLKIFSGRILIWTSLFWKITFVKQIINLEHVKVYLSYILPVVLYGLDCITWNKTISSKIEVFQNHILRIITGHRQNQDHHIQRYNKNTCPF